MGKFKIHNVTPINEENYIEVPNSDRTREKIELIGEKLLKCIGKKELYFYFCPGFNARVYYYEDQNIDTIEKIVKMFS